MFRLTLPRFDFQLFMINKILHTASGLILVKDNEQQFFGVAIFLVY